MNSTFLNYNDYTLLVVDDNPINLSVIVEYVEDLGFKTMVAQDGRSALEKAQHSPPDLILLDVMMPELDGFETCKRLKALETTRDIPVIFMTALANVEEKAKGFNIGAVDYITKPFQQEEVLTRITTHLQLRYLNKQLVQANQELIALNASKDKIFSTIAHDLRGPFGPLMGNLELLMVSVETAPRSEIAELSQSVYRSAKNVFTLLSNLLDWSRLQLGRVKHKPKSLNLQEVIEQNFNFLAEMALTKEIVLKNNVTDQVLVYADEYMLNTIIHNLVSNALKFTPSGGLVTASASLSPQTTPSWVEVAIADTGIGIREEDLAKLFRLETFHTTTGTPGESGTGLGLIICHEMAHRNGGKIWAESVLGQGTTIRFTLPPGGG